MTGLIKEDYVKFYSDPSEFPTAGNHLAVADGQIYTISGGKQSKVRSSFFSSLSEFTTAGGPTVYGKGPVWIGGKQYWCDGVNISALLNKKSFISWPNWSEPVAVTSSTTTLSGVISCPVEFSAVRIGILHRGGSGDAAAMKCIVAPSDNVGSRNWTDMDSTSNGTANAASVMQTPKKSGTTYNLATNGADPGFHRVLWSGSDTSPIITDPTANKFSVLWSDLMPVDALYDSANGFWPLIFKWYRSGIATHAYAVTGEMTGANVKTDIPGFSQWYLSTGLANDYVTTLPTGLDDTYVSHSGTIIKAPILVEFICQQNSVKSIAIAADSRFNVSNEFSATKQYLGTTQILRNKLTANGVVHVINNCCYSGWSSAKYYQLAKTMLAYDKPDYFIYLISTVNDGSVSASIAETQIRQADDIANTVKAYGGKIIFVTDFPRNSVLSASQLLQVEMVRNYAASVGDAYIDPFNLYGPGNGTWTAGVSIDGTHMYNAYYDDLASRIAALII